MMYDNKEIEIDGFGKATLVLPNWFGFLHEKVSKKLKGDVEYVASMTVKGWPWAVYRQNNPDRNLGHKDWVGLCIDGGPDSSRVVVTGWDHNEMEEYQYQAGVLCPKCKEVIYSVNRHDYKKCSCDTCMIDGGRDYTKRSQEGEAVRIDFFNMEIIKS